MSEHPNAGAGDRDAEQTGAPGPADDHHDELPASPPHKKATAVAGFVVGLALFGAAIWVLVSGEQDFAESYEAARNAPWWVVAAVVGLPVANWLAISESFRALTNRYGTHTANPVGRREMAGLIGSAWLLNYLPMKPGMFGRLAYHKHVNRIRYRDSARVIAVSVSTTVATLAILLLVAVLVRADGPAWLCCAIPAVGLAVASAVAHVRKKKGAGGPWAARVLYAGFWRYIDSMVWVGRYAASFALVGEPISFADSVVVAAVSQVALLVPVSGNGLGVREWGVRLVTSPAGLLADVVNRAAEMAVALPIGLIGTAWSVRRLRAARDAHASATPPGRE